MDIAVRLMADQISEQLRYRDVSRLGKGGFAEVFRAFDPQLRRFVALKLLMTQKPEYVERMFREARAQAKIRHQGICQIYEVGWLGAVPFLSMQLVEGRDLRALAPRLSFDQKLDIAEKVCAALQAAHERGVVHRDLKPDNIVVEGLGDGLQPYIVDFGMVLEADNPDLTGSGHLIGTPGYMAPEQVDGRHCGPLTDVYGLGATFYELFTGEPPFEPQAPALLFRRVLEEEPLPADARRPGLPRELAAVLARAMAKEPEHRYPDVAGLRRDLSRIRNGEAVDASLPGNVQRFWRSFSSHRISTRFFLTSMLLLIALLFAIQWHSASKQRRQILYGSIAEDLKTGFRSAWMSPADDLRRDMDALRLRRVALARDLPGSGLLDAGPVHYAIGTVDARLGEVETARMHLQKAWDSGFQNPEVAFELGRVNARIYRRLQSDPGAQQVDGAAEHRRMAIYFLRHARRSPAVSSAEVEAQLAWIEGRHGTALEKIREARRLAPWQHEHLLLEAGVLVEQASRLGVSGRRGEAEARLDLAQSLLVRAREQAPSDPRAALELCRLAVRQMEWAAVGDKVVGVDRVDKVRPVYEAGLEACNTAATLDRNRAEAWSRIAALHAAAEPVGTQPVETVAAR